MIRLRHTFTGGFLRCFASIDRLSWAVKSADRAASCVHKAYSLRRANDGGVEKAKAVLLEAAKLFPDDDMIQYNLACYCAQLGQLDAAKEYLGKSCELGDAAQIKLRALDDEDLKPLWESD